MNIVSPNQDYELLKSFESNLLNYTSTGNFTHCIVNEEYQQHFRVPSELKTQLKMGKQKNFVYLQNESIPINVAGWSSFKQSYANGS